MFHVLEGLGLRFRVGNVWECSLGFGVPSVRV